MNTIASSYCQHAQGKYNIADNDNKYLHIVGNGEAEGDRSNAHTLDWSGNAWFAGDVYVGGTSQDDESATKLSSVAEKLKNHTSFSVFTSDANAKTYIKLGKFTGDGAGGRAIFTINGKVGWNNKNDGGLKVLTLSSNDSRDTISTGIFTGGSFFDFGHSDNDGTSIIEDTPDIQVAIVRPSDYTVKEVDIYLKFAPNKYNSYLITVDYSGTCKWETDVKPVNATDPDPMETALSAYIVPKKRFGGVEEGATKTIVDTALSTTSTNPVQNKVVTEKIKNHASFRFTSTTANVEYIKLGKFKGDGNGGRAIITINGKQGWNEKNDGGLKILTLSSNFCGDSTSNDIYTGGTFYTFGHSDDTADSIVEGITTDIVLVRAIGYSVKEVDVYIKIIATKHISYFVTIDYSEGCSWTTSTQEITSSETSPTEGATSHFTVPKKHIADSNNLKELKTPKGAATSTSYTAPYCQSGITVSDLTELKDYRTTIGVVYDGSNNTHSTISVRHRNGASNGTSYGMYITAPLKIESNLKWRNQVNGNWGTEKTLLDSSNFTNYIPYETGTCTLSVSNGTVSNATYSVVGNMVTLNFNIAPTGAGNVVVSGLPFAATKNQSGFASSTATYNITANQTSVSINSTSGTAEYCTVTYLK